MRDGNERCGMQMRMWDEDAGCGMQDAGCAGTAGSARSRTGAPGAVELRGLGGLGDQVTALSLPHREALLWVPVLLDPSWALTCSLNRHPRSCAVWDGPLRPERVVGSWLCSLCCCGRLWSVHPQLFHQCCKIQPQPACELR